MGGSNWFIVNGTAIRCFCEESLLIALIYCPNESEDTSNFSGVPGDRRFASTDPGAAPVLDGHPTSASFHQPRRTHDSIIRLNYQRHTVNFPAAYEDDQAYARLQINAVVTFSTSTAPAPGTTTLGSDRACNSKRNAAGLDYAIIELKTALSSSLANNSLFTAFIRVPGTWSSAFNFNALLICSTVDFTKGLTDRQGDSIIVEGSRSCSTH